MEIQWLNKHLLQGLFRARWAVCWTDRTTWQRVYCWFRRSVEINKRWMLSPLQQKHHEQLHVSPDVLTLKKSQMTLNITWRRKKTKFMEEEDQWQPIMEQFYHYWEWAYRWFITMMNIHVALCMGAEKCLQCVLYLMKFSKCCRQEEGFSCSHWIYITCCVWFLVGFVPTRTMAVFNSVASGVVFLF